MTARKTGSISTKVGERIRSIVEDHTFNIESQALKAAISLGITVMKPSAVTTITDIIQEADKSLYAAKKTGGEIVVL